MAASSFYLQISPYLLLEYMYGDSTTTYLSSQVKLARVQNTYLANQAQFLNTSAALNVTQNVLNNSAVNIGGYKWAYLNTDVPVPYISLDPKITYTDLSSILPSLYVQYDKVRIHILSGYRLENIQGLIFQVYAKEAQTSNISILSNNVYLKSSDRDILNPRPILLGEAIYDRYIEFFVPSLKEINSDFYADPTNQYSIGYQYTSNNRGMLIDSAIYIKAYEINSIEVTNNSTFFYTGDSFSINVNQVDIFSNISANISEAEDGDYFIYYPTYNGGFIDSFIEQANANGGNYAVINNIDVFEQVGLDNILTFTYAQMQTSDFNEVIPFRPTLKYADSAVSFTIEYTARIYNREDAFQIIRTAYTTSFNPKKYGKQLEKIALAQLAYPVKVYNKIYSSSPITVQSQDYTNTQFKTVYVPVFYDSANIVLQSSTILTPGSNPVDANITSNVNFGQGDARIYLSPFDTYFKFIISQIDPKTGILTRMNLSTANIVLVFKDLTGKLINVAPMTSTADNAMSNGVLIFNVPGTFYTKILSPGTIGTFYLVSQTSGAAQTLLYTGSVDSSDNIGNESARVQEILNNLAPSTATTTVTSAEITTDSTVADTASIATSTDIASNAALDQSNSILDVLNATNLQVVAQSAANANLQTQTTIIPGYTVDSNASSIKNAIIPSATTASSNAGSIVTTKLVKDASVSAPTSSSVSGGSLTAGI